MILNYSKHKLKFIGVFVFLSSIICLFYLYKNYDFSKAQFQELSFESDADPNIFLAYYIPSDQYKTDFSKPIRPIIKEGKIAFEFPNNWRNVRLYVSGPIKNVKIKNLKTITQGETEPLLMESLFYTGIKPITSSIDAMDFDVTIENSYFELKKKLLSKFEFFFSFLISVLAGLVIAVCSYFLLRKKEVLIDFKNKESIYCIFLFSIFLPHPIFNVFFILSLAVGFRALDFKKTFSETIGLIFIVYFIYILINDFLITKTFNRNIIETTIPFLLMPFLMNQLKGRKYLIMLVFTAILMGFYFILTSLIDYGICRNMTLFSFDAFTKYLHPVYFSYLLFFSFAFVLYSKIETSLKLIVNSFFIVLLLFCGSKLMLFLTLALLLIFLIRKGGRTWMIFFLLPFLLLFKPFRSRLLNVVDPNSLSILKEQKINDQTDPRFNGLTLRIMLWQEALNCMDEPKEIIFGKGFDKNANEELKVRLVNRGIRKHNELDPHNQFITTFYKMGLIGLSLLLFLFFYLIKISIQQKNRLLLNVTVMFIIAAFFESYLQRIVGIYFFTALIPLLALQKNTETDLT